MELPIYKLIVNEDENIEVNYVSLVDEPATGEKFMIFKDEYKHRFQTVNEEKRLAMGALMVADLPIYRRDEEGREFYVVLDAENIDRAMLKFFKKGYQSNVNLMHDKKQIVDGVFMYQHFIINKELGIKTPKGFEPLPDGSSFGIYKVENDEVWNQIKEGKFLGFSIEGMFKQQPIVVVTQEEVEKIYKELTKEKKVAA